MKKLLAGVAALPFLAGVALAGQPVALNDTQMDKVTAGFDFAELDVSNVSATLVLAYEPGQYNCSTCYLSITSSHLFNPTSHPIQVYSQMGQ
ncbi:MAG: hypothetical protein JOY71_07585 [Acetobacteraceae bacterium]|nr:hypothetical protein [Acetobacteraceae bacterium]MBV8521972.1 hypothetical protein [Acetobacteraceae bacterium]